MIRRTSYTFSVGFFCVAMVAAAFIIFGPAVEHPSAAFLFSKMQWVLMALAHGSPIGASSFAFSSAANDVRSPQDAVIIFRPPAIPYDQVIIDRGERDGVRVGATVFAPGSVLVGAVSEVFWDSSRVVAPTSFGHELDVVLERSGTVVPATGYGAGELRIRLPRDFAVAVGDRIVSSDSARYLIGMVEEIVGESSAAIKEARVRTPINDRTLATVHVAE